MKGKLVAFSCCMAHWLDIGGNLGGMSTEIYQEGLQIPIMKLHDQGKVNETLTAMIRQNVRIPTRAMGDLRAQVTAVKTGERRFLQLLDRYGGAAVADAITAIMDNAEAMARERTRSIPDGVYEAESYMDDDGVEIGKRIPIKVKVIVKGDEMTVDLSEVSKQVRGFYNSGITTGYACAQVAYKCLTSPTDYPINDGAFRSLKVIVPPGKIVSAMRPAPMRYWMTYPMTIIDSVFKALSKAIPDRVIAGHHADLVLSHLHGINPKTSEFFIANFGPLGGGWGAKRSEDGVGGTVSINDGDTHNAPNEQSEAKFPLVVERYALVPDSGGAGRTAAGSASSAWCAPAPIWCSTPSSSALIAGRGASKAGSKAPAIRSGCAATATGRPTSRTARCCRRRCGPATPIASAPAAVAATAIRTSGRPSWWRRTCGRATCRPRSRLSTTASWSTRRRWRSTTKRRRNGAQSDAG